MTQAEEVVAAVDVGSTAAKAVFIDRQGRAVARGMSGYPTVTAAGGKVEQSPEDWWSAACKALRACTRRKEFAMAGLVLTGQMQDLVLVADGEVLGPAILYPDARADTEATEMLHTIPSEEWVRVTGNLQDAGSLPAKLLWLKNNEPDLYDRSEGLLLGAHDYVAWRACGVRATDATNASTTGLMDLERGNWATVGLLEPLGLRTDWFPELRPAGEVVGFVSNDAAADLGLPEGTPVFHGAGDAATTTLGAGAGRPGSSYVYLGTSGWLATTAPGRRADPHAGIFTLRHPDSASNILIGPMLTAGGALEWCRRELLGGVTYERIEELAASAPVGSEGLLFLPYLAGERSPFRDPDARGAFVGLGTATSTADVARSVMEGVAFAFRTIGEALEREDERGFRPRGELAVVGGGSRSEIWCRVLASVMGCPVRRPENAEDVAARGAAMIAGRALGWYGSESSNLLAGETFEPDREAVGAYQGMYEVFRDLYRHLLPAYRRLALLRRTVLATPAGERG